MSAVDNTPSWGSVIYALFFLCVMATGFITMIVYSIGLVNGWRVIVCGA